MCDILSHHPNLWIKRCRNLSFSWSQAIQLPLLELCKGKGELQFEEMSKLYVEELKIASAAALGNWEWKKGDGDHKGK